MVVKARIDDDLCTISIDTSGKSLHKRNHKEAVHKAPMRESLAPLFLRQCGYDGTGPVVDPMCGSGTFVIEAADIAAGLKPGRSRRFAFEQLAGFDEAAWSRMRGAGDGAESGDEAGGDDDIKPAVRFYGSDRDAGAIAMSRTNAALAGVAGVTEFRQHAVTDLVAPSGPPGWSSSPALRQPDRGQEAALLPVRGTGADFDELLRWLEGWAGDERGDACQGDGTAVRGAGGVGVAWGDAGEFVLGRSADVRVIRCHA